MLPVASGYRKALVEDDVVPRTRCVFVAHRLAGLAEFHGRLRVSDEKGWGTACLRSTVNVVGRKGWQKGRGRRSHSREEGGRGQEDKYSNLGLISGQ